MEKKELNIGIVGAGIMCKAHSIALAALPMYFTDCPFKPVRKVLCDVSEEIAKPSAEIYGWNEYMVGWDKMVLRDDIDLVDIVTPNFLHADIAVAAAEAGKNILCEKPLSQTYENALKMYHAAKKAGVRTAVAFNKRRWPAVAYAKKLIEDGTIGKILSFHGSYQQNTNLDPNALRTWRFIREKSGGISEVGSHIIDMCRFFCGDYDEIVAQGAVHITERPMPHNPDRTNPFETACGVGKCDCEETSSFMAKMKNGAMADIFMTVSASGKGDGIAFEIFGSEGAIRWNAQFPWQLELSLESDPMDQRGYKTIEMSAAHPYGPMLWPVAGFGLGLADNKATELADYFSAIATGAEYHPDFYDGLKVAEVVDAMYRSMESRSWIKLTGE